MPAYVFEELGYDPYGDESEVERFKDEYLWDHIEVELY